MIKPGYLNSILVKLGYDLDQGSISVGLRFARIIEKDTM